MNEHNRGTAAMVVSTGAAIAAATALARASKATGALPPELIDLLVAMADQTNRMAEMIDSLRGSPVSGRGWPESRSDVQIIRIIFPVANTPIQLPNWEIPDGLAVQVLAWPTNANTIWIGNSQASAININQVLPLAAGGAVPYRIKNSNALWAVAVAAGDAISVTSER